MAIRVSGLISGLDTDSIVQELVSAYSAKKDKYVKAQTKLDWKMDAWKDLNKKVNSLYKKLSNLKLSSSYVKKTTISSDPTKATVSASGSAINGTQSLEIDQVAKAGYITGAQLGDDVTNSTKLSELGLTGDASIAVSTKSGSKTITLTQDMTVKDVVSELQKAGISANYDEANKRMFISAKESGKENDFSLTATDANGIKALQALGVYVDKESNKSVYKEWTTYAVDANGNPAYDKDGKLIGVVDEAKTREKLTEILETIQRYEGDESEPDSIKSLEQDSANRKTENTTLLNKINYANAYQALHEALKSGEIQQDADGNPVTTPRLTEDEQKELAGYLTSQDDLTDDETARMKELKEKINVDDKSWKKIEEYASDIKKFEAEADNAEDVTKVKDAYAQNGVDGIKGLIGEVTTDPSGNEVYSGWTGQIGQNNVAIEANTKAIAEKKAYIENHAILTGAAPAGDTVTTAERVDALLDKIDFAADQLANGPAGGYSAAQVVAAQDAIIKLNGVVYQSASNSITVNGLTITALQETNGQEISITTAANAQGVYDTIKDFLKQYNELIKEMDTLYNANSAKGYEPLTDEEKDAMSDTEVEKWEKKIKDSLLRRDDRLSSVMNTMTTSMSQSFTLSDGKTYSLASFGIMTQGYLAAEENEGYMYHIDGDADDEISSGKTDKLMTALQKDPEIVQEFFQKLTGDFYEKLDNSMRSSTYTHSAFTIYNDKTMQREYDEYTKTIKKWEEKVADMEEYYYNKFSAMETALSKLQSSTSALSGLLGTS